MKLPSKVRVGYRVYSVGPMSDEEAEENGEFGNCDRESATISLYLAAPPDVLLDTFLHEINHACWVTSNLETVFESGKADEEIVVTMMSSSLAQVLIDNPETIKYITHLATLARKSLDKRS